LKFAVESFNIYSIIPQIAQAEQPNHRTQKRNKNLVAAVGLGDDFFKPIALL
jgi:hypothetical protein